jgi:hypothetical protein
MIMLSIYQMLIQSIDPTTLKWEKWTTFAKRTYYWTEDVQPLDITAVSVDGEAVGMVLVDLQREIRIDCTEGQTLISLPIESADYPNKVGE